jgi:hypothetical protein
MEAVKAIKDILAENDTLRTQIKYASQALDVLQKANHELKEKNETQEALLDKINHIAPPYNYMFKDKKLIGGYLDFKA